VNLIHSQHPSAAVAAFSGMPGGSVSERRLDHFPSGAIIRCGARSELRGELDVNDAADAAIDDAALDQAPATPYCALHAGPATGCDEATVENPVTKCFNDESCAYNWFDSGLWGCCKVINAHESTCGYPGAHLDANVCF
jgi:hypothetical protein